MDEDKLENKLNELVKEFGTNNNPQASKLAELAKQARDSHNKLRKSLDNLQEVLDYLRVCIKYQAFDLEATAYAGEISQGDCRLVKSHAQPVSDDEGGQCVFYVVSPRYSQ